MFSYGKETAEQIVIVIFGLNKVTPEILKYIRDFFVDIKKSNFLKDRFKLSSFGLKMYNVTAGNRLRFCEFCPQRRENPLNSQSEERLY